MYYTQNKVELLNFFLYTNPCSSVTLRIMYYMLLMHLHVFTTSRIESKHEVTILGGLNEFYVKFFGPSGSEFCL